MHHLLTFFLLVGISGCAAVGLAPATDPNIKIQNAYRVMDDRRAVLAEKMIRQAMLEFKEKGDSEGIAASYLAYGNLYKHKAYHGQSSIFIKWGTYDGSYNKSISNFRDAVRAYEGSGNELGAVKSLVGIGEAYNLKNEGATSCSYYIQALARYTEGIQSGEIPWQPSIWAKNLGQSIEWLIERQGCTK